MAQATQKKKEVTGSIPWVRLVSHLKEFNIIAPVLTALLGVLGFWLSPLKDRVYLYLYPPKTIADYEIISVHNPLMRGDYFVVKLHLVPGGQSLIAGQIRASAPAEYLALEDGNQLVDLDGTEKSKVISYTFQALKAGKVNIRYVYNFARGGTLQKDVDFTITDRRDGFPTFGDLTGEWGVMWNQGLGTLSIVQSNATKITGTFSLTEVDSKRLMNGSINGFVNGYNLRLILLPGRAPTTKVLYANLLRVSGPHDLSICGRLNPAKDEPFLGQVVDPNASVQEICKGANLWAKAQLN